MSVTRRMFGKTVGYATGFLPMVARAMTPEVKKLASACVSPHESREEVLPGFEELRSLLMSNEWPQAVPPDLICSEDESERKARAEAIVQNIIDEDLRGKRFLDYGCGCGDTLDVARKLGAVGAVGYEPHPLRLTGKVNGNVASHIIGYHDVILMYDVLDHLHQDSMQAALYKARRHLDRIGNVYVRCHPHTCGTGAHAYRQCNKAFLHLVFSDKELARLGITLTPTNNLGQNPLFAYLEAIEQAGLAIRRQRIIRQAVPEFFVKHPLVRERFLAHWGGDEGLAGTMAEIQFVDFQLVHNRFG